MPLPSTGAISISAINTEFGFGQRLGLYLNKTWYTSAGTSGVFTSPISMSQFRGKQLTNPNSGGGGSVGGDNITVNTDLCVGCGDCIWTCPVQVFEMQDGVAIPVNDEECLQCEMCGEVCDYNAITYNF